MCAECQVAVALIEETRDRESVVALRLGVPGSARLVSPEPRPKPDRIRCPYCSKRTALTKNGKLHAHADPATKRRCGYSGGQIR